MFRLIFTPEFDKNYLKVTKNDTKTRQKILKILEYLKKDPSYPSLKSHKVNTKRYSNVWSSWIKADLRLIWQFDSDQKLTIVCLEIGSHSGSNQVYKNKSS
jgi:addiction module RelE/StbE family toxin